MRTKTGQSLCMHMVYVTCCLLIWIICACSIDIAEGRRLTNDDIFPEYIEKRNSWWSKKSLDNLPNYQNEISYQDNNRGCEDILDVFKCYSQLCVPDFVTCSRSDDEIYHMCKVEHDLCSARCYSSGSDSLKR